MSLTRWLNEFWETNKEDETESRIPFGVVFMIVFGLFVLRKPHALGAPQFWGEDALVFFKQQFELGFFQAAVTTYAGYLHIAPRIVAGIAALFPISWAPFLYNLASLSIGAVACAWFSRKEYRWIVPDDRLRLLSCAIFACAPTGWEIVGTATNLQWYLLWLGYLLLIGPAPQNGKGRLVFVLGWAMIALTSPGAVCLAPFWLVRFFVRREKGERLLSLGCAALPLLMLGSLQSSAMGAVTESDAAFWLVINGVRKLFAWRVAAETLVGEDSLPFAKDMGDWLAYLSVAVVLGAVTVNAIYGQVRLRVWLVLSLVFVFVYLSVSILGRPQQVVMVSLYKMEWGGGRYFFVPVCVVAALFFAALSALPGRWKLAAMLVIALVVLAGLRQFHTPPYEDLGWPKQAAAIEWALDEKKSTTIEFRVNPPEWERNPVRVRVISDQ